MGFLWTEPLVLPDSLLRDEPAFDDLRTASAGKSVRACYLSDTFQRAEFTASATYEHEGFFAVAEPFLWVGNDSLYPPRWNGVRSEWQRAFFGFSGPSFSGYWGKSPASWGPPLADRLMLDGGNFPPFDCGEIAWHNSFVRVSCFFGVLDPRLISYDIDTSQGLQDRIVHQRFVNAHRFEFLLFHRLTLAWSEMVIYDRQGDGPEFAYFNPINLYYALSWAGTICAEDDFKWDLDATLVLPGLLLYGEFFVDDFQYVGYDTDDSQQFAVALGAMKTLGNATLTLDYSLATRWTFNSRLSTTKALYRGWPFGHPLGSDFQRFWARLEVPVNPGLRVSLGASLIQDGAGSIYEHMPYEGLPDTAGTFLLDPVQVDARAWASALWRIGIFSAGLTGGYRNIANWKHAQGQDISGPYFSCEAGVSF